MAHLESLVILDAAGRSGAALAFGFERAGYHVYATREADDAMAMAQTRVPQLVVVAVDGGESLSFVGRVREEAPTRELPVVGVGERESREEALRAGVDDFVTRPAFIRDVLTLSRLAVAVRQDGDDGGVVGLLEDYGLYFLVRALAVAGRSGVLELERGRRLGEVRFAHGAVVGARVGQMSGVQAFNHLLLWGEASMALRFESPAMERRIAVPVDDLLASGAGFAREFEALAGRVGGAQALYAHEPRRAAEQRAQIPAEVMALLKHYDGQKPLIDIVEDSPFKAFDTIKITYRLAELGAITRREQRDATPLSAQLAVRDWLLGGGSASDERERTAATARGVTEAGRLAAEVYAEEAAARADASSPADGLLDDRLLVSPSLPDDVTTRVDKAPASERPTAKLAPAATAPTKRAPPLVTTAPPVAAQPEKRSPSALLDDALAARDATRRSAAAAPTPTASTPTASAKNGGAAAPTAIAKPAPVAAAKPPASVAAPASAKSTPVAEPAKPAASAKPTAVSDTIDAPVKPGAAPAKPTPTNDSLAAPARPAAAAPAKLAAAPALGKPATAAPASAPPKPEAIAPAPEKPAIATPAPAKPAAATAAPAKPAAAVPAPLPAKAASPPAEVLARALAESPRKSQPADGKGKKNKRQKHPTPTATPYHAPAPPAARPDGKGAAPAPQSGKLSQQSTAQAHAKEPVFDELEEEFFARESEHLTQPPTVEDFADLEHDARRKLSPKRNWFGLGDGKKK